MATVRDYFRSIQLPWFFRKKFITIFSIVVGVLTIIGAIFTYVMYQDAVAHGRTIRWKSVTQPMTLPLLPLMLYAIVILFWVLIKLKGFQSVMLRNIPAVFQAAQVSLHPGETILSEIKISARITPGSVSKLGALRITNFRIMHTTTIAVERVGILLGSAEPDLTYTIPHPNIRQCGFGLDQKHPEYFSVIDTNGVMHSFTSVKPHHVEYAMNQLGWKRTQFSNEVVYWLQK